MYPCFHKNNMQHNCCQHW